MNLTKLNKTKMKKIILLACVAVFTASCGSNTEKEVSTKDSAAICFPADTGKKVEAVTTDTTKSVKDTTAKK